MTRLICAVGVLISVALLSCGTSVVGQCSPRTCIDGCCTAPTADTQARCLREPLNADNKTCGTGGLQCEDCSKRTGADGGSVRCVSSTCQ